MAFQNALDLVLEPLMEAGIFGRTVGIGGEELTLYPFPAAYAADIPEILICLVLGLDGLQQQLSVHHPQSAQESASRSQHGPCYS